jgi:hypothetical protein
VRIAPRFGEPQGGFSREPHAQRSVIPVRKRTERTQRNTQPPRREQRQIARAVQVLSRELAAQRGNDRLGRADLAVRSPSVVIGTTRSTRPSDLQVAAGASARA